MSNIIRLLLRKNKANGQINVSIPKKKLSEILRKKINDKKFLDVRLEDF